MIRATGDQVDAKTDKDRDGGTPKTAQKAATVCVKYSAGNGVKVELFPAECWPGQFARAADAAGLFRLRVNRSWVMERGKWTWYTLQDALSWVATQTAAGLGVGDAPRRDRPEGHAPRIPRGFRLRAPTGRRYDDGTPEGAPMYSKTTTLTVPFLGHDGRAWVFVVGQERPVPLSECIPGWTIPAERGALCAAS